ncbi:MAG: hypothetical protein QOG04_2157 [Actinomycetota bacterium]|nr:hypothetical protein [Actinomycetota bacterium]
MGSSDPRPGERCWGIRSRDPDVKSATVRDTRGRSWRVSIRMLPWRPRWRWPWRTVRSTSAEDARTPAGAETEPGAGTPSGDGGDGLAAAADMLFGEWILIFVIVAVVAVFFVIPAFVLLLEVVIVALLVISAIALRVLFRQPWLVDAVADEGTRLAWKVVGYRRSRRVVEEVAAQLQRGIAEPRVPDATLVR